MFHPLEVFIGLRYTRAKRRNHFISFISLTSMLGIALGITALITVLSVMNGATKEVRERILAMTAHATISENAKPLLDWQTVGALAEQHPQVQGSAPYVRAEAMLAGESLVSGAILRGVLPAEERRVSEIADKMAVGQLDDLVPGAFGIILGKDLALALGNPAIGDKITVITPQATVTPAGIVPRLKRFELVGLFDSGMYEYDRGLALIHVDDAAKLFRLNGGVTGLRLKLDDMFQAPRVVREVAETLPGVYWVRDWTQEHANYFRAVQIEKTAMFVILTLIVAVAAFNIVSALVMVVTDKQSDIAILRTLGATPLSVMGIFMVQGIAIGLIGTILGLIGGVSLALNLDVVVPFLEHLFGIRFMSPDVYLISDVPSDLLWSDVTAIAMVAFGLAVLATLYPAWRASRTQPAEALRYE